MKNKIVGKQCMESRPIELSESIRIQIGSINNDLASKSRLGLRSFGAKKEEKANNDFNLTIWLVMIPAQILAQESRQAQIAG
jgi:hypothetical protein